jgi:hypothetical protein
MSGTFHIGLVSPTASHEHSALTSSNLVDGISSPSIKLTDSPYVLQPPLIDLMLKTHQKMKKFIHPPPQGILIRLIHVICIFFAHNTTALS